MLRFFAFFAPLPLRMVEPDKHRLRSERDAESFSHSLLNLLHQAGHFSRGRAATIDYRQRVLGRDPDSAAAVTFLKSCAFDQPGGGDFHFAVVSREFRDLFSVADQVLLSDDSFNAGESFGCDDRIFEERPRAAAVGIIGHDQHRLARADSPHRFARFAERWFGRSIREEVLEVGIANGRLRVGFQRVSDSRHDITVTGRVVENAGAVAEPALGVAQFDKTSGEAIKDSDRNNRLAHLLTVSADVLNRRAADTARNPAQTFDAGQTALDALADKLVPILSGLRRNDDIIALPAPRQAFER